MCRLAAVELFLDDSDEEDYRRWRADSELFVAGLERIYDVGTTVDDGDALFLPRGVPHVHTELMCGRTADTYGPPLRDGDPFMGGWDGGMFVDHMTRQPGDSQQVARRLREVTGLSRPRTESISGRTRPPAAVRRAHATLKTTRRTAATLRRR